MSLLALCAVLASAPAQDLFTLQHAPFSVMLQHPKDAGLARLVQLAPGIVERLAAEQGGGAPPGFVELALALLTSEKHLRVGVADGEVPFYASLVVTAPDEAAALRRAEILNDLMAMSGVELGPQQANGLSNIDTPMPTSVALGTVGRNFVLAIGTDQIAAPDPVAAGLPKGVTPWLQMSQSAEAMQSLVERIGEMNGEEMGLVASVLQPTDQRLAVGSDGKWMWSANTVPGAAAGLRQHGAVAEGGLPLAALSRIPVDATFAVAVRLDWNGLWTLLQAELSRMTALTGEGDVDIRAEIMDELGFDLVGEILPNFGPTLGFYLSDTTGGGKVTSAVLFVEARNAAAVQALENRITAMIAEEANGEVELRRHQVGGLELSSLVFPGLPVPVVPTWTVADGFLYVGMSQQAAIAAVEAARAGGGLPQNPRFQATARAVGYDPSVVSMTFMDTPELLRDGYAYTSLVMDLAGNLARGSSDEPGILMPSYATLARGVQGSLSVVRLTGDDMVSLACADPSWTVTMTAVLGLLDRTGAMMMLPMILAESQRSSSFDDADWSEPAEMEWHEPILPGGSLVPLHDWMATESENADGTIVGQLELHFSSASGTVTVYGTDADVVSFVRMSPPSMTMTVYDENDETIELTLQQVVNEQTGESVGDSTTYRVVDERVKGRDYLRGTIASISIGGKTFQDIWFWASPE